MFEKYIKQIIYYKYKKKLIFFNKNMFNILKY